MVTKYPFYHKFLYLLFFLFPSISVKSQALLGAGYGTFNIPGASTKLNGTGATLKFEYIGNSQRTSGYLDVSYYAKTQVDTKYSYIYSQLGVKKLLGGDADQKKVLPFIGGGFALVFANSKTSGQNNPRTIFGLDFHAGLQYNIKPVILELKGNLDLDFKPLVENSGVSNIMTNLRFCVLVPISK